jgi:hypothetical protein
MRTVELDVQFDDDGARDAMLRVHAGDATKADYAVVRSYLRTTEGKAVASNAVQQLNRKTIQKIETTYSAATGRVMVELHEAHIEAMRDDLYEQCSTTAERLVVDEVVAAYTRLQLAQRQLDESQTMDRVRFWDKQVTSAQRRYLRCLETLSRIRRYEVQLVERNDADGSQQRSVSIRTNS